VEVKPGYKQTEVGVMPEAWDVSSVAEMGEVVTGKALAAHASGKQRPYLRTKNVFDGRIDIDDVLTMPMTDEQFAHFRVRSGDVLLNEGQSLELVGRCSLYSDEYPEPCAMQNQLLRFRASEGVCSVFASYLFRRCQETGVFARIALQTTSIAHLGGSRFERLRLAWPQTEEEQCAIAQALSDVDGLLGGLDRLIAKKRNLKLAAMQELLTGQIRLPGFSREWDKKRLGDHVKFLRNGVNSRAELLPEGPVKYLHYGNVHASKDVFVSLGTLPCLPAEKAASLDRLWDGDLIFADASEDTAGISKSVEVRGVGDSQLVSGLHTIAARFDKAVLADGYKGFLQFCPTFATHLRRLAAGTKVYATSRTHIASVEMRLPAPEEQTAIATVLSDMDAEIAALERRCDKTRALKQAMMQELLTGRTRLVTPEAALA
jgi:type I restriction enzyme, S subunit